MSTCEICTYVFAPHSIGTPDFSDKFCSVEANLDDIVEQCKRWCQREGGHKQSHKPILDYCICQDMHTWLQVNAGSLQYWMILWINIHPRDQKRLTHFHVFWTDTFKRFEGEILVKLLFRSLLLCFTVLIFCSSILSFLFLYCSVHLFQLTVKQKRYIYRVTLQIQILYIKQYLGTLTVRVSQTHCFGWVVFRAWSCWAGCTAQWGSQEGHTIEGKTHIYIKDYRSFILHVHTQNNNHWCV